MSEERMRNLEIEMAAFTASVKSFIEAANKRDIRQDEINSKLFELVEKVTNTVHGEGGDPGIKGRVDRLETKGKIATWFAASALVTMMGHTIKVIAEWWRQ